MAKTDPVTPDSFSPRLPRPLWLGIVVMWLILGSVPFQSSQFCRQSAVREAYGEEAPKGKRSPVARRDDSAGAEKQAREIERLIDGLASRNKAPMQRGKGGDLRLEYPDDYDEQADEVVKSAGDKLIAHGAAAFPLLIEHFRDQRFSHVIDTPGGEETAPVSEACRSIIACQLEVFAKIGIYPWMVPSYFWDVVEKDEKPDEWWKSHQKMSLYEMQTEAVEWAISQQKMILKAGKYRGENFDSESLADIIARNERTLETLRETRKAIAAKRKFPTRLK